MDVDAKMRLQDKTRRACTRYHYPFFSETSALKPQLDSSALKSLVDSSATTAPRRVRLATWCKQR